MDVEGGNIQGNGVDVIQYAQNNGPNQVWLIVNKDESPPQNEQQQEYGGFAFNIPNPVVMTPYKYK